MSNNYDVIVVGAGPGGSTAAYHLARTGLRTLLLEKDKMPRYKPCGGGITEKVPGLLDFDLAPAIEATITRASLAYRAERTQIDFRRPVGWCVMRPQFDQFLAARAAQAGAEVRDAQPVTRIEFDDQGASLSTRNETLHTPLVVGADGVNSLVRRAAKFPAHRRLGVALEAELQVPSAALDEWCSVLHLDFGAIPWGYGWIFPKADHLSVGIGALLGRNQHLDLRAELARYIRSEPSLAGAQELLTRGHRVPLGGQMGRYHSPHAVLVGDAAGIVDPFTAEGIYYAILSGQMAAEEIVRAFAHGGLPELSTYTRRINTEINADLRMAWTLNKIFYRMPHFAYRVFKKSHTVQNAAAEMMMGALTYPQMMLRILKKTPRALLRA